MGIRLLTFDEVNNIGAVLEEPASAKGVLIDGFPIGEPAVSFEEKFKNLRRRIDKVILFKADDSVCEARKKDDDRMNLYRKTAPAVI